MSEKYGEIKKTDQSRPKFDSELQLGRQIAEGSETKVFKSGLKYKGQKMVHGLVYKKIHYSDTQPEFGRMGVNEKKNRTNSCAAIRFGLEVFRVEGEIETLTDSNGVDKINQQSIQDSLSSSPIFSELQAILVREIVHVFVARN
ncbi:MAG TPA: hypothetical protein VJJ02_01170 [Candidatus Paceibacterota bacterium]